MPGLKCKSKTEKKNQLLRLFYSIQLSVMFVVFFFKNCNSFLFLSLALSLSLSTQTQIALTTSSSSALHQDSRLQTPRWRKASLSGVAHAQDVQKSVSHARRDCSLESLRMSSEYAFLYRDSLWENKVYKALNITFIPQSCKSIF